MMSTGTPLRDLAKRARSPVLFPTSAIRVPIIHQVCKDNLRGVGNSSVIS